MKWTKYILAFIIFVLLNISANGQCAPYVSIAITTAPGPGCKDSLLGFTATPTNLGASPVYKWFLNGSLLPVTTDTFSTSALNDGDSIYVVAYGAGCTASDTAISLGILLDLKPMPSANFKASRTVFCTADSILLTASDSEATYFQWNLNGLPVAGASGRAFVIYPSVFLQKLSLTVANGTCVNASAQINIFTDFLRTPVPPPIMKSICSGKSLTLAVSNPYSSYQWLLNGVNIPGATNPFFAADSAGIYSLYVSDSFCDSTYLVDTIIVKNSPVVNITASSTMFCDHDSATLTALATAGVSYKWQRFGTIIPGATTPVYIVKESGTYYVVVNDTNGCATTSSGINIDDNPLPTPTIEISGDSLYISATFVTYQWNINGVPIPGATQNSYIATADTPYSITVTDANGCTGTSPLFFISTNWGQVTFIPNASSIKIYPDPATSVINISSPIKVNISLIATDGKTVLTKKNATQIDIAALNSGYYTIRITDTDGNLIKMDKIVKM